MNLIIEASLSEPPSSISCFRDVTLFAKAFVFNDILLECQRGTRSNYWHWLKNHGAHDFISELVLREEKESGFRIATREANINVDKIYYDNLSFIVSSINQIRQ